MVRSLRTDRDENGNALQQTASVGNYTINFTTGSGTFNPDSPYRLSTAHLAGPLNQVSSGQVGITIQESVCDSGQACVVITSQDWFRQPETNADEAQAFWGAGSEAWLDAQTGEPLRSQAFWLLEDGSRLVEYTLNTLLIEKVSTPPQEILDLLGNVIVPPQ